MSRNSRRLVCAANVAVVISILVLGTTIFFPPEESEAVAQLAPDVMMDPPIECWFHNQHPLMGVLATPPEEIRSIRLYFRCSAYLDYYFVDFSQSQQGDSFEAVAPMAEASCPSVHYYVEALAQNFDAVRTEERIVDVTTDSACKRDHPLAAWYQGAEPGVTVGAVVANAPPIPPGFQAGGIVGFITATGVQAAAASGGSGSGLLIGGVAAAAGGGALAAVAAGGDPDSTTSIPEVGGGGPGTSSAATTSAAPDSTSSAVTTSVGAPTLDACFSSDPNPAIIEEGESIRLDARCSIAFRFSALRRALTYMWDLGDGRRREGALINPVYRNLGMFTIELTVSDGSTTDSTTKEIVVTPRPSSTTIYFRPLGTTTLDSSVDGFLGVAPFDGSASGYVRLNDGPLELVNSQTPVRHILRGKFGREHGRSLSARRGERGRILAFRFFELPILHPRKHQNRAGRNPVARQQYRCVPGDGNRGRTHPVSLRAPSVGHLRSGRRPDPKNSEVRLAAG